MGRLILRHLSPRAECDLHQPGSPAFVLPSHSSPASPVSQVFVCFPFLQTLSFSYFINKVCFVLLDPLFAGRLSPLLDIHSCPPTPPSPSVFSLAAHGVSRLWELSAQDWCLLADGRRSRGQGSRAGGQQATQRNKKAWGEDQTHRDACHSNMQT